MKDSPAFSHLAGIKENVSRLALDIQRKKWGTSEAEAGAFFVTSDCPVVTMKLVENGPAVLGSGFGQEDVVVAISMSPRKIFIAGPKGFKPVFNKNEVTAFNTAIINFAERAIYASEESDEIQALVDKEIDKVRYGQNSFIPSPRQS
jgi:Protein of unknown function (DUF4238)